MLSFGQIKEARLKYYKSNPNLVCYSDTSDSKPYLFLINSEKIPIRRGLEGAVKVTWGLKMVCCHWPKTPATKQYDFWVNYSLRSYNNKKLPQLLNETTSITFPEKNILNSKWLIWKLFTMNFTIWTLCCIIGLNGMVCTTSLNYTVIPQGEIILFSLDAFKWYYVFPWQNHCLLDRINRNKKYVLVFFNLHWKIYSPIGC